MTLSQQSCCSTFILFCVYVCVCLSSSSRRTRPHCSSRIFFNVCTCCLKSGIFGGGPKIHLFTYSDVQYVSHAAWTRLRRGLAARKKKKGQDMSQLIVEHNYYPSGVIWTPPPPIDIITALQVFRLHLPSAQKSKSFYLLYRPNSCVSHFASLCG